jgi:hypothetical protein
MKGLLSEKKKKKTGLKVIRHFNLKNLSNQVKAKLIFIAIKLNTQEKNSIMKNR